MLVDRCREGSMAFDAGQVGIYTLLRASIVLAFCPDAESPVVDRGDADLPLCSNEV